MRNTFLILLLSITALTGTATPALGTNRRADINHDNELDVGDVNTLLDEILSPSASSPMLDINEDGAVDVGDINIILELILNPEPYYNPSEYISGTLPVIHIDTEGFHTIYSKEHYWQATYWLDPMGQPGVAPIGDETHPLPLQIKGRGNASWRDHTKKPYRMKFDKKASPLGLPSSKHFLLLPRADEASLMLDEFGFEIGRRINLGYTPRQLPVELVLNGDYVGVYFICEKIRVDKNRVDITEQKDGETAADAITGGWLFEIENYWYDATFSIPERESNTLFITTHTPEVLSDEQLNYIKTLLLKMIDAVYTEDKTDETWQNYIDIESLAKFYIIQEMMDNVESFSGSCFMYKDHGDDTKIKFGPLWDLSMALYRERTGGVVDKPFYDVSESELLSSFCNNHLIPEIVKFPSFQAKVREIWNGFYSEQFMSSLGEYINAYSMRFREAGASDIRRWHPTWSNHYIYSDNAKKDFSRLEERCRWLDSQWNENHD